MAHEPGPPVGCGGCGAPAPEPLPLTWSTSHGPRGTSVFCGECTRRHLRAMEAKLDEEHW
jgi:hypothetical protein